MAMPTLPAPMTETLVRRRCGTEREDGVSGQSSATGRKKPREAPPASKPSSDNDEVLCIFADWLGNAADEIEWDCRIGLACGVVMNWRGVLGGEREWGAGFYKRIAGNETALSPVTGLTARRGLAFLLFEQEPEK